MKTFDLNRTIHGVGDLSDGILIAMCLKNMLVTAFFFLLGFEINFF
jgi:hypothetical protein